MQRIFLKPDQVGVIKNCVYGLEIFCQEVFKHQPDRTILPGLITQSPLELLFGILKNGSNRKLTLEKLKTRLGMTRTTWDVRNTLETTKGKGNDESYVGSNLMNG